MPNPVFTSAPRRRRRAVRGALGLVVATMASVLSVATAAPAGAAEPPLCAPQVAGGPLIVTAACVDPVYGTPIIDSETDLAQPVPVHKVSGHFDGTDKRFNFYFPLKSQWKGRFFDYVYPLQDENATDENVSFGAASGAYTIQTNGGGGYQVDAAAAKFSKVVAARYYGTSRRIHGYIWGGSGGSFQVVGSVENTVGVWDGAVPFIVGTPTSIPNNFFVREFARLVLQDKATNIADAVRPGGSGDPYADLDELQSSVLREVSLMGVPLRGWEDYRYLLGLANPGDLLGFGVVVRAVDPTYGDDFWSKDGYLGTEQSALGDYFRRAQVDQRVGIAQVNRNAENTVTSVVMDSVPPNPLTSRLDFTVYPQGATSPAGALTGTLDPVTRVLQLADGNNADVVNALAVGAEVRIDNRWGLALSVYHRYQVPQDRSFYPWNQFRDAAGSPIYPQRAVEIGALIGAGVSGGAAYSGNITTKVILVDNRLDVDAYPWQADWYAQKVKAALGTRSDDMFRLWFNDNADHIGAATADRRTRLVEYTGVLQQALRDVSAWAEKGTTPPRSTPYAVVDSQIVVTAADAAKSGVQPVIDLSAKRAHGDRIDITAGQTVNFKARMSVPRGTGKIVRTEWDFLGTGNFTEVDSGRPRRSVEARQSFTYTTPGTYFAIVRATSERNGSTATPFAAVANIDRLRIVVH